MDVLSLNEKLDRLVDKFNDHPTNGELGIKLDNLAKEVGEIKVQTTLTNGRVTALENASSLSKGKGEGMRAMWGWIVAGISLTIAISGFALQNLRFR